MSGWVGGVLAVLGIVGYVLLIFWGAWASAQAEIKSWDQA